MGILRNVSCTFDYFKIQLEKNLENYLRENHSISLCNDIKIIQKNIYCILLKIQNTFHRKRYKTDQYFYG